MDKTNEAAANSVNEAPPANGIPNDGTGVIQLDPYLEPFKGALKSRFSKAQKWIKELQASEGGLEKFSRVNNLPNRDFCSVLTNRRDTRSLASL